MGILAQLIQLTPFKNAYNRYKQQQNEQELQELDKTYFPKRVQFYKEFIQPGDLVFDVGANVGNRVEAFLACQAKVVAVEPQPACVKVLQEKLGNKIIIEQTGLSDAPGELEMQISTDSTVSTFNKEYVDKTKDRFKFSRWNETIKVPVTTMDALISKHGTPKFCKIDVEGFELFVLKGLHTKIPYLSIEYCVPEMQEQNMQCLQHIHSLAPEAKYNYSIGESMQWAFSEWKSFEDFAKHVASPAFMATSFGDIYVKTV